jgi:hypothetical protein
MTCLARLRLLGRVEVSLPFPRVSTSGTWVNGDIVMFQELNQGILNTSLALVSGKLFKINHLFSSKAKFGLLSPPYVRFRDKASKIGEPHEFVNVVVPGVEVLQ